MTGSPFRWIAEHPFGTRYRADFYCPEAKVVVEVDGSSHWGREAYDAERDAWMRRRGMAVLRFTNAQVDSNTQHVVAQVNAVCSARTRPRPAGVTNHVTSAATETPAGIRLLQWLELHPFRSLLIALGILAALSAMLGHG